MPEEQQDRVLVSFYFIFLNNSASTITSYSFTMCPILTSYLQSSSKGSTSTGQGIHVLYLLYIIIIMSAGLRMWPGYAMHGWAGYLGTIKVVESYELTSSWTARACLVTQQPAPSSLPSPKSRASPLVPRPWTVFPLPSTARQLFSLTRQDCTATDIRPGREHGAKTCSLRRGDGSAATGRPSPLASASSGRATS